MSLHARSVSLESLCATLPGTFLVNLYDTATCMGAPWRAAAPRLGQRGAETSLWGSVLAPPLARPLARSLRSLLTQRLKAGLFFQISQAACQIHSVGLTRKVATRVCSVPADPEFGIVFLGSSPRSGGDRRHENTDVKWRPNPPQLPEPSRAQRLDPRVLSAPLLPATFLLKVEVVQSQRARCECTKTPSWDLRRHLHQLGTLETRPRRGKEAFCLPPGLKHSPRPALFCR